MSQFGGATAKFRNRGLGYLIRARCNEVVKAVVLVARVA